MSCWMLTQTVSIQFPLQGFNAPLSQAMTATAGGLQMFLWGDADQLHRVLATTDFDRTFVAAVMNIGVIEATSEALCSTL